MKRLVIVNNIPTPYRMHLFSVLHAEMASRGMAFEAWFMANTEPHRQWHIDVSREDFPATVFRGLHPRVKHATMHLNPSMPARLTTVRPDWMVIGGAWLLPTSLSLLLTAKAARLRTSMFIWAEANSAASRHPAGNINRMRKRVLERADGVVVPGEIAVRSIQDDFGIRPKRLLRLPNIVDERVYESAVASLRGQRPELRARLGVGIDDTVILLPIRLDEESKGPLNFLSALGSAWNERLVVVFAGDGPARTGLEAWMREHPGNRVHLLGYQEQPKMIELFALADAVAVPSKRDPNPIAVVEALWSGLPVIVSEGCGNWPEALEPRGNGWLVDASQPATMRTAVESLLATPVARRWEMGKRSQELARERFDSRTVVRRFLDQLETLTP